METERLTQSVRKRILECCSLLVGPVDFLEAYFSYLWISRTKSNICILLYSWEDRASRLILIEKKTNDLRGKVNCLDL